MTQGVIPAGHKDWLIESLTDIVGYMIILFTSIAAVVHALRHPVNYPGENNRINNLSASSAGTPPSSQQVSPIIQNEQHNLTPAPFVPESE